MRDRTPRNLLSLGAGFASALAIAAVFGAVAVSAATRYDDLSLFTSVLARVKQNYVEAVDERRLIHGAVRGMLPKNALGRQMLRKLKVYAGPEHPHAAQKPEELPLA